MKAKKILKTSASIGLVVPQVACAGAGMTLGGLQMGFQALADGTGYLKGKCYRGENRIADYRKALTAADAAVKAAREELKKSQEDLRHAEATQPQEAQAQAMA